MKSLLFDKINHYICEMTVIQRNINILHWNLLSENFISLHQYLINLCATLNEHINASAEQIRILEVFPIINLDDCIREATISSLDSTHFYTQNQALEFAISMIKFLKGISDEIAVYSNNTDLLDVSEVFINQSQNYSKILYYLKNSMII